MEELSYCISGFSDFSLKSAQKYFIISWRATTHMSGGGICLGIVASVPFPTVLS